VCWPPRLELHRIAGHVRGPATLHRSSTVSEPLFMSKIHRASRDRQCPVACTKPRHAPPPRIRFSRTSSRLLICPRSRAFLGCRMESTQQVGANYHHYTYSDAQGSCTLVWLAILVASSTTSSKSSHTESLDTCANRCQKTRLSDIRSFHTPPWVHPFGSWSVLLLP
jgi:hypothetical protein